VSEEDILIELKFPAKPDRLRLIRRVIQDTSEFAGADPKKAERAVIAVNEAIMNIIQHAYAGDDNGEIILHIISVPDGLTFSLTDFAGPVNIDKIKPRDLDDIRPGGLGTHFINEVMDSITYEPLENSSGNKLTMVLKV
jgi:anti-sigma regulatory factor (Ser/Thr protein kinase)